MLRTFALSALIVSSFLEADFAFAQQSPPICPEKSWAVRSPSGWTCSKAIPSPSDPPAATSSNNNSNSNMHGHGRSGGGVPQ